MRPARASKYFEPIVIRGQLKKALIRGDKVDDSRRKSIDEIGRGGKGFIPKL
jgi:hypothetical protein